MGSGVEYEVQLPRASGWRVAVDLAGDRMSRHMSGVTQFVRARDGTGLLEDDGHVTRARVYSFAYPVELHFLNHEDRSSVPSKRRPADSADAQRTLPSIASLSAG